MSNTPNNPFNPQPEKGPWLYSGANQPTPAYTPPVTPTPLPAQAAPLQPAASATPAELAKRADVASAPPAKADDDASLAGIIDTIEAIIIALILALTFRAFIVEAFVIPTGSMAPTLLGAHFKVICPKCGYAFDRDASLRYQLVDGILQKVGDRGELLSNRTIPADGDDHEALICPNCQYVIPYDKLPQALPTINTADARTGTTRRVPFSWANNGDRILVLKYIYSIMEPHRFDVIVFKEPMNAQDNFIKRLIGLPGETIEIIGGDIYVTPTGEDPANLRLRTIARKPVHIQKYLWQLVYNNDYYPTDEGVDREIPGVAANLPGNYFRWHNPWAGEGPTAANWAASGPVIHYSGNAPGTLAFNAENREPYGLNILGYNNDIQELYGPKGRSSTLLPVGDLHLETEWTPREESGSITLSVGSKRNLFAATWSGKTLTLQRYNLTTGAFEAVKPDMLLSVDAPRAGRAYHVEFNNVDRSVQFFIDGQMVLEQETSWSAAELRNESDIFMEAQQAEQNASLLPGNHNQKALETMATYKPCCSINVSGESTLGHLKLMRDLYYTPVDPMVVARIPGAAAQGYPLTLNMDEFFAMGDNSRKSHDGRSWQTVYPSLDDLGTRRGIVPRRYLLGKAFFVYWPAGYRLSDNVPPFSEVPLVPNVGDMRFIR